MKTVVQAQPAPEVQVDPTLKAQQQAADASVISSLQSQAAGDTANIMTRYGISVALANSGIAALPTADRSALELRSGFRG